MACSAGVSNGFGRWPGGNISGCSDHGISNMGTQFGIIITYRGSTMRLSLYQGFVTLATPFVVSECYLVFMPGFLVAATHTSVVGIEVVPVAPTVVCVKVAPHGAWSKNTWDRSWILPCLRPDTSRRRAASSVLAVVHRQCAAANSRVNRVLVAVKSAMLRQLAEVARFANASTVSC